MLKTLDVLIGLSVIMFVLSMVVTILTQALIHCRQTRGKHLLEGLVDLLRQLDPALEKHAEELAKKILNHPLIREAEGRLGTVIYRAEFTRALLELASHGEAAAGAQAQLAAPGASQGGPTGGPMQTIAEDVLLAVLKKHNVLSPSKTLDDIRALTVELERSNPNLAASALQNLAILHATAADLLFRFR